MTYKEKRKFLSDCGLKCNRRKGKHERWKHNTNNPAYPWMTFDTAFNHMVRSIANGLTRNRANFGGHNNVYSK